LKDVIVSKELEKELEEWWDEQGRANHQPDEESPPSHPHSMGSKVDKFVKKKLAQEAADRRVNGNKDDRTSKLLKKAQASKLSFVKAPDSLVAQIKDLKATSPWVASELAQDSSGTIYSVSAAITTDQHRRQSMLIEKFNDLEAKGQPLSVEEQQRQQVELEGEFRREIETEAQMRQAQASKLPSLKKIVAQVNKRNAALATRELAAIGPYAEPVVGVELELVRRDRLRDKLTESFTAAEVKGTPVSIIEQVRQQRELESSFSDGSWEEFRDNSHISWNEWMRQRENDERIRIADKFAKLRKLQEQGLISKNALLELSEDSRIDWKAEQQRQREECKLIAEKIVETEIPAQRTKAYYKDLLKKSKEDRETGKNPALRDFAKKNGMENCTDEDIADVIRQLDAVANDPNKTIVTSGHLNTGAVQKPRRKGRVMSDGTTATESKALRAYNQATAKPIGGELVEDAAYPHHEYSMGDLLKSLKFSDEVQILMIESPPMRLMCHFMGQTNQNNINSTVYKKVRLITLLMMQQTVEFMEQKGYSFAGEVNFSDNGSLTPVRKWLWQVGTEEISFTSGGLMFFEKIGGEKQENVALMCNDDAGGGYATINCYSHDTDFARALTVELYEYTKKHNCLRGSKIRNLDVVEGKFYNVHADSTFNWDNYYYDQAIIDIFKREVFGFLGNPDRYNSRGITRRGLLLEGEPGTGKTTLGKIICNESGPHTVVWITPELVFQSGGAEAICLLYEVAEFVASVVIILEDIDLYTEDRDNNSSALRLGALMNILDGVNSINNAVTIAMTNRIDIIEKALRNRPGRFDKILTIPPLCKELREKMFINRLSDCQVDKGVVDLLVKRSGKWTGAQVQDMIHCINMYMIEHDMDGDKKTRHVTVNIVEEVMKELDAYSTMDKRKTNGNFGFGAAIEEDG
jgi:hypothetical protein